MIEPLLIFGSQILGFWIGYRIFDHEDVVKAKFNKTLRKLRV